VKDEAFCIDQSKFTPLINYYFCFTTIIPKFVVEEGVAKYITHIHESLHLKGFQIITYNNKIKKVVVYGIHPHLDPNNDEYCLPDYLRGAVAQDIEALKLTLIYLLEAYNLDDCYRTIPSGLYETKPFDAQGESIRINPMNDSVFYGNLQVI